MIREELRGLRDIALRVSQWGVTLLVSLQTALFFFRKDVYERMLRNGDLKPDQGLPLDRYVVGTTYLTIVALIFFAMSMLVSKRFRFYYDLLETDEKALVPVPTLTNAGRWLIAALYFIFPVFDLLVKLWVRFEIGLR